MFRARDAVKFGASRVCPMCNSGPARWGVLSNRSTKAWNNVGIRRAQRRTGKIRADVWTGTRAAGGVPRPFDECIGAGGPARRVLHQPAQSGGARHGLAHHQSRTGAREGISAVGDGRVAPGETKITELTCGPSDSQYSDSVGFPTISIPVAKKDSSGVRCQWW